MVVWKKHGNEKYRQQAICESYLSQEMKPTSCGMHLTLEFFDTSQSISLLSLLESSTSDFKCVAEKKPFIEKHEHNLLEWWWKLRIWFH